MPIIRFVERDTEEWHQTWALLGTALTAHGLVEQWDEQQAHEGEVWQYMGSTRDSDGSWAHQFRHRAHPVHGERLDWTVWT